ncbi:hypothetical protein KQI42_13215 [Tissierella sp. MSJ-40]|uniref:Nicotianamine synthase protein n=1 Tax=Tissierella simiarum TaxID=2841534 RepID=A0ABS6E8V3_9FIRM|nr:nicotianamine synthase family protein [Tissierella simiarum]MBU5438981.1 hypothetical protein [Tissierella simiarum]
MITSWTKWMEKKISNSNFLIGLYENYYRKIVKDEVKLAEMTNKDKVLCIGGGSIPCTALQIANLTGAEVHVIDIDRKAVNNAKNIIRKMGLGNKIYVTEAKGEDIDVGSYNVIHIALQVTPKERVVEHIWSKSTEGTRIVVRLPKKSLKCFYSNLSDEFLSQRKPSIEGCCLQNRCNTMKEILLMVKGKEDTIYEEIPTVPFRGNRISTHSSIL